MTEAGGTGTPKPAAAGPASQATSRRRMLRWGAAAGGAIVLLAGGGALASRALQSRYDVPGADLVEKPGGGGPSGSAPTQPPGVELAGPLNMLLVGIDPRVSVPDWEPHADAVLILHVAASLDRAYLFSLPRDLLVAIPEFPKARFQGARTKLTHAMSYGSRVAGSRPSAEQGFQLLERTVRRYLGIERFNAGAVLNFGGFTDLVDAVGGVEMYIDQRIVSKHREPNGKHRKLGYGDYVGPQMVYPKGLRKLTGWQALDVARQRYISGGDYARQRHQQQIIKALARKIVSRELVTNPVKLDQVLRLVGKSLVFDGGGHPVTDYAYTLRRLRPDAITLVGLPGGSVGVGGGYQGERLQPVAKQFFAALRGERVDEFLRSHPKLVNKER
jgi:LCP family protein required for cell wall assembly